MTYLSQKAKRAKEEKKRKIKFFGGKVFVAVTASSHVPILGITTSV
jgi:hypothetical protein